MASKVAYLPFEDGVLLGMAESVVDGHNSFFRAVGRFKKPIRMHPAILNDVRVDDQLYVIAHCEAKSDSVFDCSGNKLEMPALARRLLASDLPTDIRVIKLWACWGGTGGEDSTANKLLQELRRQGFHQVVVSGYTAELSQKGFLGSKYTKPKPGELMGKKASKVRVSFR